MIKLFRVALPIVLAFGVGTAVLPGCGGGDSNGISSNVVRRYAGNYGGTFGGTILQGPNAGSVINGTFTATVDNDGNVTGAVTQPGVGTFSATGTITRRGSIVLTSNPSEGQLTRFSGTARISNSNVTLLGDFITVQNGVNVVTGTFTGARDTNQDL